MATKLTLTPKDCLYMEDIVNASMLIYKKIKLEKQQLENEELTAFLENICMDLKDQAQTLTDLMKGALS